MAKSAATKYQSSHYPKKVREAAKTLGMAKRLRKKLGEKALGKPKSSRAHKDYKAANSAYQKAGRNLAKLTGYKWQ